MTQAAGPEDASVSSNPSVGPTSHDQVLKEAETCLHWYGTHARKARKEFLILEVILLFVCSLVPISGILTPNDARLLAILGAVVATLTGLRSVFHWREDWLRFTLTSGAITCDLRLYRERIDPYSDPKARVGLFIKRLYTVESNETLAWSALGNPKSKDDKGDGVSSAGG